MNKTINLKGITWSDPRGYDPMIATSKAFSEMNPSVRISWDKRSLQGFESTPVDELAATYDLMIIDHPHVGAASRQGCLLPMNDLISATQMNQFANETIGKSFASYQIDGLQWALPVDVATQVQAHRPDSCERMTNWSDVCRSARNGHVIVPLRPPHNLMCLYTIAANIGHPCGSSPDQLLQLEICVGVLETIMEVTDNIDFRAHDMDPIVALDALADSNSLRHIPLTYLYKCYAESGYRENQIVFTDIPVLGKSGPIGSALGGTGLAISSGTKHPEICANYAAYIAGATCQSGLYAASNGQPGNAIAWASEDVNKSVLDAYFNTRLTHEAAWLRPRHDGYMSFQQEGSEIIQDILKGNTSIATGVTALNQRFAASHG